MCLSIFTPTKKVETKIAKKDIVAYKVLIRRKKIPNNKIFDDEAYTTPYTNTRVELGKSIIARSNGRLMSNLRYYSTTLQQPVYDYDSGEYIYQTTFTYGVHSYSNMITALAKSKHLQRTLLDVNEFNHFEAVVVKAFIPKGTEYIYSSESKQRVSLELKLTDSISK
jgi:hypothetical protein